MTDLKTFRQSENDLNDPNDKFVHRDHRGQVLEAARQPIERKLGYSSQKQKIDEPCSKDSRFEEYNNIRAQKQTSSRHKSFKDSIGYCEEVTGEPLKDFSKVLR